MGNGKVLQATNVCNWNFAFQWRHHYSAEVPVIGEELGNRNHAEDRDQVDAVRQKHRWGSNPKCPWGAIRAEGTREEWQKSTQGGKTEVYCEKSLKYLLGSLSPSQPHHCLLLPAFESIMVSPAHLEIWRGFGSFNTKAGKQRKFKSSWIGQGVENCRCIALETWEVTDAVKRMRRLCFFILEHKI